MAAPTVATHIVDSLAAAGVQRIYGVVGDSLNGLTQAVRKHREISWIPVRHEESGAFAAGAEAQLDGRLAVCAGSSGPGCIHLINGLYDAHRSLAPVLAIAAHIPSSEIGTGYFQESHPERVFVGGEFLKANAWIRDFFDWDTTEFVDFECQGLVSTIIKPRDSKRPNILGDGHIEVVPAETNGVLPPATLATRCPLIGLPVPPNTVREACAA